MKFDYDSSQKRHQKLFEEVNLATKFLTVTFSSRPIDRVKKLGVSDFCKYRSGWLQFPECHSNRQGP